MSSYRSLNRFILAKLETTSGTDASPTPGSNAVLVEAPDLSAQLQTTTTSEVTGALDKRSPIATTGSRQANFKVYLRGSGVAGTAPRLDPLMQACGLQPQILAADSTGTAQAGSATTITLAAGAPAVDLTVFVVEATSGAGAGSKRIISAYNTSTKAATVTPAWNASFNGVTGTAPDNTTTYVVRKGVKYFVQSAILPTVTVYSYQPRTDAASAKLTKLVGGAGNVKLTLGSSGCSLDYQFKGSLVSESDPSVPTSPTYDSGSYFPLQSAQIFLNNIQAQLNSFNIDLGNDVQLETDPSTAYGVGNAGIVSRSIGGDLTMPKLLNSSLDIIDSWQNGTEYAFSAIWGSTAGQRFACMSQHMVFNAKKDNDVQGFSYDQVSFKTNGQDTGLWLTYY